MINDPRISALLCAGVAGWLGYSLLTEVERPSPALLTLNFVIIGAALAGLIGAVRQMRGRSGPPPE